MAISRYLRRHPIITAVLPIACIGIMCAIYILFWPSVPDVTVQDVAEVEVRLIPEAYLKAADRTGPAPRASTTNSARIKALLDVFESASRTSEHKCAEIGVITFRMHNGSTEEIRIIPGHDSLFYEYRYRGINRVPREPFLAALRDIGLSEIPTDP
jgi:hypothetical protein